MSLIHKILLPKVVKMYDEQIRLQKCATVNWMDRARKMEDQLNRITLQYEELLQREEEKIGIIDQQNMIIEEQRDTIRRLQKGKKKKR